MAGWPEAGWSLAAHVQVGLGTLKQAACLAPDRPSRSLEEARQHALDICAMLTQHGTDVNAASSNVRVRGLQPIAHGLSAAAAAMGACTAGMRGRCQCPPCTKWLCCSSLHATGPRLPLSCGHAAHQKVSAADSTPGSTGCRRRPKRTIKCGSCNRATHCMQVAEAGSGKAAARPGRRPRSILKTAECPGQSELFDFPGR